MGGEKPDHQHFIPRSYLKQFAEHKKEKRFVDAIDIDSGKKLYLSTKDICVKKGLYTITNDDNSNSYELEKYYAENVDAIYPEVYKLLVDKNTKTISNRQKHKIINTLLSLYFRTPKLLHTHNELTDRLIDRAVEMTNKNKETINIDFDGKEISFKREEIEKVKSDLREESRRSFLATHLEVWHQFVTYKYRCAISVFEIDGDVDLITSDNPVSIHSSVQNRFHLFDPTNIIEIPLDRKHFLFIFPNTEEEQVNKINRGKRDKYFALTTNLMTQKNAEKWVIGFPGTVEKHFSDQKKYGEVNEENLKMVDKIKEQVEHMSELLAIAQEKGMTSREALQKVKQLRKLELFEGNHDLAQIVSDLDKAGYSTD